MLEIHITMWIGMILGAGLVLLGMWIGGRN